MLYISRKRSRPRSILGKAALAGVHDRRTPEAHAEERSGRAVFSGSLDGHLRAYDTRDGSVLWDFDTAREFQTTNGIRAHGGSMNAAGPAIVDGVLYVNTGYTNAMDGNALLAFAPQKE